MHVLWDVWELLLLGDVWLLTEGHLCTSLSVPLSKDKRKSREK